MNQAMALMEKQRPIQLKKHNRRESHAHPLRG